MEPSKEDCGVLASSRRTGLRAQSNQAGKDLLNPGFRGFWTLNIA
jgi:hypothetical protein